MDYFIDIVLTYAYRNCMLFPFFWIIKIVEEEEEKKYEESRSLLFLNWWNQTQYVAAGTVVGLQKQPSTTTI